MSTGPPDPYNHDAQGSPTTSRFERDPVDSFRLNLVGRKKPIRPILRKLRSIQSDLGVQVHESWNKKGSDLPRQERLPFYDRRLCDLLSREDTPCNGVSPAFGNITPTFPLVH